MGNVYVKSGVLFTMIAPGGFRILSSIDQVAEKLDLDLIITSACDGLHSGVSDPHHRGEAYDIRSHDFTDDQKDRILAEIREILGPAFYIFLESPNSDSEHFHAQVRKGTTYPNPSETPSVPS